jgi:hypothetical protein
MTVVYISKFLWTNTALDYESPSLKTSNKNNYIWQEIFTV